MTTGSSILAHLRAQDANTTDGVATRRMFLPSERYVIDFDRDLLRAWKQYDTEQDAHYFGTWVNLATREVLTYAEGDWTLATSADAETFRAELARMAEFYGSPPPAAVGIAADGTVTEYFDPRPTAEDATS